MVCQHKQINDKPAVLLAQICHQRINIQLKLAEWCIVSKLALFIWM